MQQEGANLSQAQLYPLAAQFCQHNPLLSISGTKWKRKGSVFNKGMMRTLRSRAGSLVESH